MEEDNPFFCAVCGAWFSVLIIGFVFDFPLIMLSFMLGMSATGIAKKSAEYLEYKGKNFPLSFFLFQLIMTIIGLIIIYNYQ